MSVEEAVEVIVSQLAQGADEIEVASDGESQMMKMKREDPTAVFRALEGMAEQDLHGEEKE